MHAHRLLANNIAALLAGRHHTQKELAVWCRHSEVWISKILRGERQLGVKDLDRIADFFGIATYQLFQPGISPLTERRSGKDRRKNHERRVGHAHRTMLAVQVEVERARPERRRLSAAAEERGTRDDS